MSAIVEKSTVWIDNSAAITTWSDMIGRLVVTAAIMTLIWMLKYHRRKSANPQILTSVHENDKEEHQETSSSEEEETWLNSVEELKNKLTSVEEKQKKTILERRKLTKRDKP